MRYQVLCSALLWCVGLGVTSALAEDLPEPEVLAQWGAVEWAEAAERVAPIIEDEFDREDVLTNILFALCQVPGQEERVEALADASVQRIQALGGDPLDADYQYPSSVYAYARIGKLDKARQTHALIQDPSESTWGLLQLAWGTAERQEIEATAELFEQIEAGMADLDEFTRGWYEAEVPMLMWLVGQQEAAMAKAEAIVPEDASADALLYLGDLAMDFGDEALAEKCLNQAQAIMKRLPDRGLWQVASAASLKARLGAPDEAAIMMLRLNEPYEIVQVGGEVARAYQAAGNAQGAEQMLTRLQRVVESVRPEPGFMEAGDIAYLWSDWAVAAHDCGRVDMVAEAWAQSDSSLTQGMIATGIAIEIAWVQWIEQHKDQVE
ncbi:hypothetical protein [Algisphaera agarilytica]|uniref:Tetratricopeptide repeat-containing protein n=1 Tax=Algisphaera agarilytica TaxID=1385975 RepID=A0A7X0LLN1_9BACT|nr:hypothetical protein [Algisphaera agarilytica]MBB6431192.1 hypothetical protein [Algisphaera agarilytica]